MRTSRSATGAGDLRDSFTPSVLDLWTTQTPALDIVNELRRDRRQSLGCVGLREFLALLLQEFEFRLLFCDALRHQFFVRGAGV